MNDRAGTFRIAVRRYPPFESAIHSQWESFEAEARTGLTLDLVPLDLHDLEAALFTLGGMRNGDWDIAFTNTDWIATMDALGAAADLAPLLAADPPPDFPEGWAPSLLRLQRIGPAVLGVPYHDGPECLILRRDIFEDAETRSCFQRRFGRPLSPPATWADFHTIARFLHDPAAGISGTVFAAFPDGHNTVYDFLLQLWTRNGELFDSLGQLRFNIPEAAAALSFYRAILTDPAAVPADCVSLDSVAAGKLFAEGKIAMMVNWFGFAAYAHTSADSRVRGLVDIAAIPAGDSGTSASLNVYWLLSLASGSPHRELGWQFLRYTQTPAMDLLTSTSGAIGCRRSTWQDATLNTAVPFYHRLEELHQSAREIPLRADWPRIASVIDELVTAAVRTTTPIPELLARADASAQRLTGP